jgi:putative ABC transport system permease protein
MRALDRKLLRDLARLWAQALTIALVLASGIASFVAMRGAHASILAERDAYYADRRFADVFAHVERAPLTVRGRIERLPGVARVHTRIVRNVLVPIEGEAMPAVGQIVSLPSHGEAALNPPRLRAGRFPEEAHPDEVLLLEAFAEAHRLGPGSAIDVVLEGTRRQLHVVGIAMSPEYVFAVGPGSFMNDPARFGVFWMDTRAVASAFQMESSFDDVVRQLLDDVFGLALHASSSTVRRILDEEGNVTSVLLVVDPAHETLLLRRLPEIPRVASIARRQDVVAKFHEQTRYMWVTMTILTVMGATIAFGVVYNQARIALSTRSRDLASLRVLGFTRREISAVLLGELGSYVVLGVPLGWILGRWLVALITMTADPENYRMPTYVSSATYAFGTVITIAAAAISALVVRRRLDQLDLVSVLKARE